MNWNKVFIIASLMMSTAMLTSGYEGEDQGLKVETTLSLTTATSCNRKVATNLMPTRGQSTNLLQLVLLEKI